MDRLALWPWYRGEIPRERAETLLSGTRPGHFLVSDSREIRGGFVLSVSESGKVSHYIINFKEGYYQIGEQTFPEIPSIIEFYKSNFLGTTTLKEPVPNTEEVEECLVVRGIFDFNNDHDDPENLSFKKGDLLTVTSKDYELWWTATDSIGRTGTIPVSHIEVLSGEKPTNFEETPRKGQYFDKIK